MYQVYFLHLYACVDILRKFDDMIEVILPQLPTTFDSIHDPEGRAALIWILGEYGEVHRVHVHACIDSYTFIYTYMHVRVYTYKHYTVCMYACVYTYKHYTVTCI